MLFYVVFYTAGILHQSLAGAMLSKILHSLLLLPVACVQSLLFHLLGILAPLDCLNRVLPDGVHCEQGRNILHEGVQSEQESNSSSGMCLFCCTVWLFVWYESEKCLHICLVWNSRFSQWGTEIQVFWDVTRCQLVNSYQHFVESQCSSAGSSSPRSNILMCLFACWYGITSQKTWIFIRMHFLKFMQSFMYVCRLREMDVHLWVNSMFQWIYCLRFLTGICHLVIYTQFFLKHFDIAHYSCKCSLLLYFYLPFWYVAHFIWGMGLGVQCIQVTVEMLRFCWYNCTVLLLAYLSWQLLFSAVSTCSSQGLGLGHFTHSSCSFFIGLPWFLVFCVCNFL